MPTATAPNGAAPLSIGDGPAPTTSPPSVVPPSFLPSIPHLFAGQPLAAQMGPHGKVGRFPGVKGVDLASYWWPAVPGKATKRAGCKGAILFIHGHGSYCLHEVLSIPGPGQAPLYAGSWAEKWNQAGYSLAGLDARGAGFSGGLRCFTEAFGDYVADVSAFAAHIHEAGGPGFAGLPVFLVGVSLGGCIAVHAAEGGWVGPPAPTPLDPALARPPPPHPLPHLRGAVLLAPMLALDAVSKRGWNRVLLHVGKLISLVAPAAKVARMPKNTLHPELQALWDADPLCWHEPTRARNGMEYLKAVKELAGRRSSISFPFLALHGEKDTLTDPSGTAAFAAGAGSADKTFVSLPGRWHILVREPGNEEVLARIIDWCDARL